MTLLIRSFFRSPTRRLQVLPHARRRPRSWPGRPSARRSRRRRRPGLGDLAGDPGADVGPGQPEQTGDQHAGCRGRRTSSAARRPACAAAPSSQASTPCLQVAADVLHEQLQPAADGGDEVAEEADRVLEDRHRPPGRPCAARRAAGRFSSLIVLMTPPIASTALATRPLFFSFSSAISSSTDLDRFGVPGGQGVDQFGALVVDRVRQLVELAREVGRRLLPIARRSAGRLPDRRPAALCGPSAMRSLARRSSPSTVSATSEMTWRIAVR